MLFNRSDGFNRNQFLAVHMNDISVSEDLLTFNTLLYYKNDRDWKSIGQPARRSVQNYENNEQPMR